jgi:hypothetical protein
MIDRNLARGLFLIAVSIAFGVGSLHYAVGDLSRAGPGMFPLIVSGALFLIGLITLIRARLVAREPLVFNFKNIAIIMTSLVGLAAISQFVNMIAGIVFMVFFASLATKPYSVSRVLKISAGLILVGLAFQKLLGFNLPLY